ncbi:hypothetical protein [Fictibacillus barbaricus]|uniref:Uncharacterized protein n=1 Tax=Fictibacillus barbaricus TaxID=182136 RepID=A0ABU1U4G2_9BACL|nr:hypothetical protein [Fictibacillus barbaricus]MDR7074374.1 hypothetical protein [Fictibacillus barbaricus]
MWNKITESILVFKTMAGLFFSAAIIIYVIVGYMMGASDISFEIIVQFLFLSFFITCLNYLFWNEDRKLKMSAVSKVLLQYVLLGAVLFGMSQLFDWFKFGSKMFYQMLILYHIIFAGGIFGFSIYFKVLGMKFNKKMLHYREQNQAE